MKKWRILVNPVTNEIRAIKEGFNWAIFFFGVLWFLYQRMFLSFIGWFLVYFGVAFLIQLVAINTSQEYHAILGLIQLVIDVGILIFISINGGNWAIEKWKKKGYEDKGTVLAPNKNTALMQYLQKNQNN